MFASPGRLASPAEGVIKLGLINIAPGQLQQVIASVARNLRSMTREGQGWAERGGGVVSGAVGWGVGGWFGGWGVGGWDCAVCPSTLKRIQLDSLLCVYDYCVCVCVRARALARVCVCV